MKQNLSSNFILSVFRSRLLSLIWILILCGTICHADVPHKSSQDEIQLIRERLIEDAITYQGYIDRTRRFASTDFSKAGEYLNSIQPNGTWADVDYTDTLNTWSPLLHLDRMLVLTAVYSDKTTQFHQDPLVLKSITNALQHWYIANPTCKNWYKNDIGKQFFLQQIGLLIGDKLPPALFTKIVNDLTEKPSMGGVNMTWLAMSTLYRGVLEENPERIQSAVDGIKQQISIQENREGLKPDYTFQQHGHHLYNGMYGTNFISDNSRIGSILRDTRYAFSDDQVNLLRSYYFKSMQWMIRRGLQDYNVRGRQVGRIAGEDLQAFELIKPLHYLSVLNPENKDAYLKSKQAIEEKELQPVIGNRHFWWSDYTAHQRTNYMTSLKMCSERTLGVEISVNTENLLGYWLPYGLTYLYKTGEEYDHIFPAWDWGRLPGVTQPHEEFPIKKGRYTQQTQFVGGVSDGHYGVSAMDLSVQETSAKKAWFWFEDEWVALGAGIQSNNENPIVTSVNQTLLDGEVIADGTPLPIGSKNLTNPNWVLHNGVGYLFPDTQSIHLKADTQHGQFQRIYGLAPDITISKDIFSLWFDHGKQPTNGTYEYIVVPSTTPKELSKYSKSNPIEILSNTKQIQAVHQTQLGLTGIVFHQAGSITLSNGLTIQVSAPSILLINHLNNEIHICDPTAKLETIEVSLTQLHSKPKHKTIQLPSHPNAGKSLQIKGLF